MEVDHTTKAVHITKAIHTIKAVLIMIRNNHLPTHQALCQELVLHYHLDLAMSGKEKKSLSMEDLK
jgi:hypothetical protein